MLPLKDRIFEEFERGMAISNYFSVGYFYGGTRGAYDFLF